MVILASNSIKRSIFHDVVLQACMLRDKQKMWNSLSNGHFWFVLVYLINLHQCFNNTKGYQEWKWGNGGDTNDSLLQLGCL